MSKCTQLSWLAAQALPHREKSLSGSAAGHPAQLYVLEQHHLCNLCMRNHLPSTCLLHDIKFDTWFAGAVLGTEGGFLLFGCISKWIFIWHPSTTHICQLTPCVRLCSWFCKFHEDPRDSQSARANRSGGLVLEFGGGFCYSSMPAEFKKMSKNDTDLCNDWHRFLQHLSSLQKKFAV